MTSITVSIDLTDKYMTLFMDLKPLTFTFLLYLPSKNLSSEVISNWPQKDDTDF